MFLALFPDCQPPLHFHRSRGSKSETPAKLSFPTVATVCGRRIPDETNLDGGHRPPLQDYCKGFNPFDCAVGRVRNIPFSEEKGARQNSARQRTPLSNSLPASGERGKMRRIYLCIYSLPGCAKISVLHPEEKRLHFVALQEGRCGVNLSALPRN